MIDTIDLPVPLPRLATNHEVASSSLAGQELYLNSICEACRIWNDLYSEVAIMSDEQIKNATVDLCTQVKLGLNVPSPLMAQIKEIAFLQRRSVTNLLVEQLEQYVQEYKSGNLANTIKRQA